MAFDLLKENPPELMLLDLNMPRLNGMQLLKKLSTEAPDVSTKVIIHSGHVDQTLQNDCKALGAKGFIRKPTSYMEISNLLQQTLNS